MKILIFLLLISSSYASEKESTFGVGNGRSGVLKQGKVYLRDLYWGGDSQNATPWIGDKPHRYEEFLLSGLAGSAFDSVKPLVSRKLNDIDMVEPGLGFLVGQAILKMNWIFKDDPLRYTCDTLDDIFDSRSGMKAVQIANRYRQEVWIDRGLWEKMADEHRAALIIHEGIYSLAPESDRRLDCRSPMIATRKFVNHAFSSEIAEGIEEDALNYFKVGGLSSHFSLFDEMSNGKIYQAVRFSFAMKEDDNRRDLPILPYDGGTVLQREILAKACTILKIRNKWPEEMWLNVYRPPFYLFPEGDGFRVAFQRVTGDERFAGDDQKPNWQSRDQCVNSLNEILNPWFRGERGMGDPYGPGGNPKHKDNKACAPDDYLDLRPDVEANPYYSNRPVLHYLDRGADQGMCNPGYTGDFSKCTEAQYLEKRPDVAAHKYFSRRVTEHFIDHGVKEGMCDPR